MKELQEILKPYFIEGQTDYDIATVLRYILSFGLIVIGIDRDYINFFSEARNQIYRIENKPINLYTEVAKKNLLELLTKIYQEKRREKIKVIEDKIAYRVYNIMKPETIGHSVLIGDILEYFWGYGISYEKNADYRYYNINEEALLFIDILNLWQYKTKPIEEQSEDLINYIYNLIK